MKLAAVQFAPEFKAVGKNIQTAMNLVGEAVKARGAHLVVLPELCTTGYSFMSVEEASPFGEYLSIPPGTILPQVYRPDSVKVFKDLAQKLGVCIVWGLMEKEFGTGDLYNAQAMALPDGRFASYRKINRWGQDYIWAKEGTSSPPVMDYRGKKVGMLICRDVRDKAPSWEEFYEKGDADIVAFSTNWGDGGFPSVNWVKFAMTNKTWLVVANRYGREANNDFGEGGPCVISPDGDIHCEGLRWSEPCIVYAETP